jgi:hypothetical protein
MAIIQDEGNKIPAFANSIYMILLRNCRLILMTVIYLNIIKMAL